ncbi:MAG TPA: SPOR domain-containing protein, partial [Bacteroidia bacterium]
DYINESGSVFAFENGEARFIWTSIPSSEEIKVSYKLTPDPNASIQKPAYIDGSKFSYIENNQTNTVAIDKQEITEGEQITTATATTSTNSNPTNVTTNTQPENTNTNTQPDNTTTTRTDNNTNSTNEATTTTATTPKSGNVHYSVQIGAFQKSVNANSLGRRFSIKEAVRTEMQDGYTKCIIGKFNEYKIARDNRETVRGKGVNDAFVTAYNSGKRITVQEALMVSNQKWYR